MLDAARERARELNHRGALFPWRTITGQEASARYVAGTAQYHINADIAHALRKYRAVTGDDTLMLDGGAEVLVETARFWLGLGFFSERRDGQFVINAVTGPDEYTTVVDNNAYTNLMARENLEAAAEVVEWLANEHPLEHARLVDATGLVELEPAAWRRAAARMHIPRADGMGPPGRRVHGPPAVGLRGHAAGALPAAAALPPARDLPPPGDQAGRRRARDLPRRPPLHAGGDPADVRLLRPADDRRLDARRRASRASWRAPPATPRPRCDYFHEAATVDLYDTHGNTADGIHIASCGGTWLALVAGFGGLRDYDGEARFAPAAAGGLEPAALPVRLRGQRLEVDMTPGGTTYTLLEGDGLTISHFGEPLRVCASERSWRHERGDLRRRRRTAGLAARARLARGAARADDRRVAPPALDVGRRTRSRRSSTSGWSSGRPRLDGALADARALPRAVHVSSRRSATPTASRSTCTHLVEHGALRTYRRRAALRRSAGRHPDGGRELLPQRARPCFAVRASRSPSTCPGRPRAASRRPTCSLWPRTGSASQPEHCTVVEDAPAGIEAAKARRDESDRRRASRRGR